MAQEGGRNWYQSIHFDKLVCRKVFFFGPKGTPLREEHKTISSVLTTFTGALIIGVEKSGKTFPRRSIQNTRAHSVGVPTVYPSAQLGECGGVICTHKTVRTAFHFMKQGERASHVMMNFASITSDEMWYQKNGKGLVCI